MKRKHVVLTALLLVVVMLTGCVAPAAPAPAAQTAAAAFDAGGVQVQAGVLRMRDPHRHRRQQMAAIVERPGRNPYEQGRKWLS